MKMSTLIFSNTHLNPTRLKEYHSIFNLYLPVYTDKFQFALHMGHTKSIRKPSKSLHINIETLIYPNTYYKKLKE